MISLETLVDITFTKVVNEILPELTRCIFTDQKEKATINTLLGDFIYIPHSSSDGYQLMYGDVCVFSMVEKVPEHKNIDQAGYAIKSVLTDMKNSAKIRIIILDLPAGYGPEKVEVDYEDLSHVISLARAAITGTAPNYLVRLKLASQKQMENKIIEIIDGDLPIKDKVAEVKRLQHLVTK